MDVKFSFCSACGNLICKLVDSGVTPECCGSEMVLLEPQTTESGSEKHLPLVEWIDECTLKVKIGSQPHPCTKEHHIMMIALELKDGLSVRMLDSTTAEAVFHCRKCEVTGVYSYCNLHGLWYLNLGVR